MFSYFCDGGDLVLRDCPAGELFVDALEDLVADVDHLGSAERRVLHAHVHALGCLIMLEFGDWDQIGPR